MMSSQFHIRGTIHSDTKRISQNGEGYTLLVIRYNIPFKTMYLRFCIWDDNMLVHNNIRFKEGYAVDFMYEYAGHFPILSHTTLSEGHDVCFRCYAFHEQANAQRMECEYCRSIRYEDHKERLALKVKLVEKTVKPFKYSSGLCLKFFDVKSSLYYEATIFEKNPLFNMISGIELLNDYQVIGWKENNSVYNRVDVVDILNVI